MQHRVNEILNLPSILNIEYSKENWGHCTGVSNPADLGSRGYQPAHLKIAEYGGKVQFGYF